MTSHLLMRVVCLKASLPGGDGSMYPNFVSDWWTICAVFIVHYQLFATASMSYKGCKKKSRLLPLLVLMDYFFWYAKILVFDPFFLN